MQSEQRLGAGRVQLRQVEQGRPAQGPGDLAVLPARLGASLAVPLELGGSDQGHIAHLAREGNAVVGETHEGGELFDVVVLTGPHMTPDGQVQGHETI